MKQNLINFDWLVKTSSVQTFQRIMSSSSEGFFISIGDEPQYISPIVLSLKIPGLILIRSII